MLTTTFRPLMEAAGEDSNYTSQSFRRTEIKIMEALGEKLTKAMTGSQENLNTLLKKNRN